MEDNQKEPKKNRKRFDMDTKEKARSYYLRGFSLQEISELLKISVRTLESWQMLGKWTDLKSKSTPIKETAYNLRVSGKKNKEIAEMLGITQRTVITYIKQYKTENNIS
jgi:uncharacterized protein YjcR